MTAPIVHSVVRSFVLDADYLEGSATKTQAAENHRHDIPGQLWERLTEVSMTSIDLSHVTDAQADRMHAVLYSAGRLHSQLSRDPDDPNQRVRMFGRYQKLAAGRIRAGVRIK